MRAGVPSRATALAMVAAAAGCVPSGRLRHAQAPGPAFDPIAFFAGRTEGHGTLRIIAHARQPVLVVGRGAVAPDGSITLDQDVRQGDEPPKHRQWRLHRVAPGRYAGTLTDAFGPVTGEVEGNRLTLAFTMKGGLHARQWLYLQPRGQAARNRLVITKFGVPVASLDETIERRER